MIVLASRTSLSMCLRTLARALAALMAAACGGGGGGGAAPPPPQRVFINWIGSANGVDVVEYDNENIRFFADTGTMVYRGIEFVNVVVDASADVIWNGQMIGSVYYVWSTPNPTSVEITALVSNNGTMIYLYQGPGGYAWADSGIAPAFAVTLQPDALEGQEPSCIARTVMPDADAEENGMLLHALAEEPDARVEAFGLLLGPPVNR